MFDIIREAHGTDDWVCVHSLGLAHHASKRRGEIDFALLTPLGVLVLEVKGGRVERTAGEWVFIDRFGVRNIKREGPFDQAASAMFALERELRARFGGSSRLGRVLLASAVMFPDIEFHATGVDADRRQVYDLRDRVRPLAQWVRAVFDFARALPSAPRNGLDRSEIEVLADYLRGDFDLVPSFHVAATDVNRGLTRLTRQQSAALPVFERHPRLLVEGSAGTGKSLVAVESARRASAAGMRVLVLCFNKLLAARLRAALQGVEYVDVHHAHDFMRMVIADSSLVEDFAESLASADTQHGFDVIYPEYASLALAEAGKDALYDCVVVDEGQDLLSLPFTEMLDQALRGGLKDGAWRIVLDVNEQAAVYGRFDRATLARLAALAPTVVLTMNCRNTTQIEVATRIIARPQASAGAMQAGDAVEQRWYDDSRGLRSGLNRLLAELRAQNVSPGHVSVVYPQFDDGIGRTLHKVGAIQLMADHVPMLGSERLPFVTHSTASAFKGLENDVVVVAGVESLDDEWWRAVTYVALSRARVRLYVLIHSSLRAQIDRRFADLVQTALGEGQQ